MLVAIILMEIQANQQKNDGEEAVIAINRDCMRSLLVTLLYVSRVHRHGNAVGLVVFGSIHQLQNTKHEIHGLIDVVDVNQVIYVYT